MTTNGFIYKMTFPSNRIYIGQSHLEESIFYEKYFGSGRRCKLAVEKYGKESIIKEILQRCVDQETLDKAEAYWIEILNARDPEIGYNLAKGGYQIAFFEGEGHSDESKQKISEASKKDWQDNPNKQNSLRALKANAARTKGTKRPEISEKIKASLAFVKDTPKYKEQQRIKGRKGAAALKAKGGHKFTEEQNQANSERLKAFHANRSEESKEEWRAKISESHLGQEKTEEHKEHLSKSRKQWIAEHREEFDKMIANRSRTATHKGKTYEIYDAQGNVVSHIERIVDFCKANNVAPSYMYKFIDKERPFDDKISRLTGLYIRKA